MPEPMIARSNDLLSGALQDLEAAAYRLATGREIDAPSVVHALDADVLGRGTPLLGILRETAPRVDASSVARKRFFHAVRALVALHRR